MVLLLTLAQALTGLSLLSSRVRAQDTTPTGSTQPNISKSCNGWHTVVNGDGCWSIEQKYGITHAQFLAMNPDVSQDCLTNFWPGSAYCVREGPPGPTQPNIAKNCNKWHTVGDGDTGCWSVEQKYGISHADFIKWNPDIPDACNANFWPKYAYCVGVGAAISTTSTRPSSTTTSKTTSRISSSSAVITSSSQTVNATYSIRVPITGYNLTTSTIETSFPPQRTQTGQPTYCNNWYYAEVGNTCESIVGAHSWLTEDEFLDWNPTLGDDCSGLYIGWWYCVGIQPRTSGATFEWVTSAPPVSTPASTAYTPTTYSTANSSFIAQPTQAGMPSNCQAYYKAQTDDTCQAILKYKVITEKQFFDWNPALAGNCQGMWVGYYYCVAAFASGTLPMPATETAPPASLPAGQISSCTRWYQRTASETCDEIVAMFGIFSKADFITWNPSAGSGCTGLADDAYYCVSIPGTPTTRTAAIPTTSMPSETPTQSGTVAGCRSFWLVSSTDTCSSIAAGSGITEAQLLTWNPAVGTTSCSNLKPNYYVCVGVGGTATTVPSISKATSITTSKVSSISGGSGPSTTTGGGGTISTPVPHQSGMVSGCRRFYLTQGGQGCWDLANAAGISLDNFYAWNPAVGQCQNLWKDTWYCIGIAGPVTTISSGPPVPT